MGAAYALRGGCSSLGEGSICRDLASQLSAVCLSDVPAGEWVSESHRRVPRPPDLSAGGSVPTLSTDETAVATLLRAEAEGMVGRVFPKDRDLERLSLGSGSGEHCVSYAEASWMAWSRAAAGSPTQFCSAGRRGWAGGCSAGWSVSQ